MTGQGLLQLVLYLGILVLLVKPLGALHGVGVRGQAHLPLAGAWPRRAGDLPRGGHRCECGHDWKRYALAVLLFNLIGFLVVYLLQRLQGVLPLNPQDFGAVSPDSSFNTAVSFATQYELAGLRRRDRR